MNGDLPEGMKCERKVGKSRRAFEIVWYDTKRENMVIHPRD
jgi:hypothetical protein